MSDVLVRPVKEEDIEAIIAIDARVTGSGGPDRSGFWRGILSLQVFSHSGEGDLQEAAPASPYPLCYVAEMKVAGKGEMAGFIVGDVQSWQFGLPRHGRIVAIGVHPERRRSGVATALTAELLKVFDRLGLPFVHCLVRPGDPLSGFFETLGFRPPGFSILERSLGVDPPGSC